ncbi:MAG: hypothetical protein ACI4E1_07925, partial [Lachnospira sp.]
TPAFVGTPEREGYTFKGWNKTIATTVTEDIVYTAQWEIVETEEEQPVTGDASPIGILLILMIVSGLTVLGVYKKKMLTK